MNFIQKNAGVIAVIALVIAVIGVYTPVGKSVVKYLGGVTNYDEVDATAIKIGGSSGTRVGPIIEGTCTLLGANLAVAASTTQAFDCAVTGVVAGDFIQITLPTTTPTTNFGWKLHGANASSTSGFITILLTNLTGGTQSPAAGGNAGANSWASTTQYRISHPVTSVPGL